MPKEEVKHASKKSKQEKNNDQENDNDDSININKFELDLLEFVVKLNLPLTMCDSILKFIKLYFESDSNIISKATLGRAKAMNILTHCIKPVIQDKIEMIMKTI